MLKTGASGIKFCVLCTEPNSVDTLIERAVFNFDFGVADYVCLKLRSAGLAEWR